MGIQNFPTALQPIIQQNFLETEFQKYLQSELGYRRAATRETFRTNIGETLTKTRPGLKAPRTTPMQTSGNTNLDNGLTPAPWTIEQYTATLRMYGDTQDLNIVTQKVGIVDTFLHNVKVNATQASQTLDELARNKLFAAYGGYNTRVRVALGSPGTTLSVDDITGFGTVLVNNQPAGSPPEGIPTPVSANSPLSVMIGASVYSVTAVAADASNVSTAFNGVSGTLTTSANVSTSDGALGNAVVAVNAPTMLRPNSRTTAAGLVTGDLFTMGLCFDAAALLKRNAVPTINGLYNVHLDPVSERQLFADPDFKQLFQGSDASKEFRMGRVIEIANCRFIPTTEAPVVAHPTLSGVSIRHPLVLGEGALLECDFEEMTAPEYAPTDEAVINVVEGIVQVTREPIDRLKQIIAQSWYWIGDFVAPTDFTVNSQIVPTASAAYNKRGVVIQHVG